MTLGAGGGGGEMAGEGTVYIHNKDLHNVCEVCTHTPVLWC